MKFHDVSAVGGGVIGMRFPGEVMRPCLASLGAINFAVHFLFTGSHKMRLKARVHGEVRT